GRGRHARAQPGRTAAAAAGAYQQRTAAGRGRPARRSAGHPAVDRSQHCDRNQGGDPMSWFTPEVMAILIAVIKAIVILLAVVIAGALLSFVERRLLAVWQDRYGPNRVGPFGMFQIVADMLKMFFKEDWTPPFADKLMSTLSLVVAMSSLMVAFIAVAIAPTWGVASLTIGPLVFFAMAGLTVHAVRFAGGASNHKFALLGGRRAAAQTLSYEVF